MASAAQSPTLTIWLYRSLALGSSIAVALNIVPLMTQSSIPHAIKLGACEEPFLARAGIRRMAAAARKSDEKRRMLLEQGSLRVLGECAARGDEGLADAALHAVAVIVGDEDAGSVVRESGLRDALGGESCGDGCRAVWTALGVHEFGEEERRKRIVQAREEG